MFSRCSLDVLRMFAGFFQDVLIIQRNSMIPNYSIIAANPKVYGDTSITDGLVTCKSSHISSLPKYTIYFFVCFARVSFMLLCTGFPLNKHLSYPTTWFNRFTRLLHGNSKWQQQQKIIIVVWQTIPFHPFGQGKLSKFVLFEIKSDLLSKLRTNWHQVLKCACALLR